MNGVNRFVTKLEQIMICCAVPVMLVMGVLQIVSRFIIHAPIAWSEQLLTFLFIWTSYLGASLAVEGHNHFEVDLFMHFFKPAMRKILTLLGDFFILLFCLFMAYKGCFLFMRTANQSMAMLSISIRWLYLCIPVTAAGMSIHVLNHIVSVCGDKNLDNF
ncbi:MAG: TRAP transporter small permease [Synergistaceae bacterium]|nr:TRAP transporter small permease [Synergistaceae bacterium]